MRHLARFSVSAPTCLSAYTPGRHSWGDLKPTHRDELRHRLGQLQKGHCAYCECDLTAETQKPHIEHFVQRGRDPSKTFLWENLFWSCTHEPTCGKHKDRQQYLPSDLLKPDMDEPRHFLRCGPDGGLVPRSGLTEFDANRARETIRVFALNESRLVAMRRAYISAPQAALREIVEAGLADSDARQLIDEECASYSDSPFSMAIRDQFDLAA